MALQIVPYTEDWIPKVRAFNARLKAGGADHKFPESHIPAWLPAIPGRSIYQEYFLAVDDGKVRGAYILKHQEFTVNGEVLSIGNYQLPLSEGIIDKQHAMVGVRLLADVLKRQPLLYALGLGGAYVPLAKQLAAMGWSVHQVPFYTRIFHPAKFLRNISYLRQSAGRRLLLDLLAFSGVGWCLVKLFHLLKSRRSGGNLKAEVEEVESFGEWSDSIWESNRSHFTLSAVRDSATLNILYPEDDRRFIKLKVSVDGQPVGWVVMLATQMSGHKYFGNMKLGSIVDCLALPGRESTIIHEACKRLQRERVDLIVSNQCHRDWCEALAGNGFFQGPSNFLLFASRDLAARLAPFSENVWLSHFNRGDGDGPIHL